MRSDCFGNFLLEFFLLLEMPPVSALKERAMCDIFSSGTNKSVGFYFIFRKCVGFLRQSRFAVLIRKVKKERKNTLREDDKNFSVSYSRGPTNMRKAFF